MTCREIKWMPEYVRAFGNFQVLIRPRTRVTFASRGRDERYLSNGSGVCAASWVKSANR
jgi:hypothetical protein